jgi:hypothetical protein
VYGCECDVVYEYVYVNVVLNFQLCGW